LWKALYLLLLSPAHTLHKDKLAEKHIRLAKNVSNAELIAYRN